MTITPATPHIVKEIITIEHTQCLGHKKEVGRPTNRREQVRKISERQLELFNKDAEIKDCSTEMTVKDLNGLFNQKEYTVFMNYHHIDDVKGCDNFAHKKQIIEKIIPQA